MPRTLSILGRAARIAAWAGVVAVVALLATVTMLPQVSDLRSVTITGRSMGDSLPLGSLAIVEPVSDRDVRVGDVITYDRPVTDERVTHRVTAVGERGGRPVFRTKGDGNERVDPWRVQYVDSTAWRVAWHVPVLGRVVLVLQSPPARIALVGLPTLVLLLVTLQRIWAQPVRPAPVTRTGVRA